MTDTGGHFSPRGWVFADRALDMFWHDRSIDEIRSALAALAARCRRRRLPSSGHPVARDTGDPTMTRNVTEPADGVSRRTLEILRQVTGDRDVLDRPRPAALRVRLARLARDGHAHGGVRAGASGSRSRRRSSTARRGRRRGRSSPTRATAGAAGRARDARREHCGGQQGCNARGRRAPVRLIVAHPVLPRHHRRPGRPGRRHVHRIRRSSTRSSDRGASQCRPSRAPRIALRAHRRRAGRGRLAVSRPTAALTYGRAARPGASASPAASAPRPAPGAALRRTSSRPWWSASWPRSSSAGRTCRSIAASPPGSHRRMLDAARPADAVLAQRRAGRARARS